MRQLSERVTKIHVSPIRKVAAWHDEARKRSDMISFGGGAPSLPPPREFLDELNRLLQTNALRSCGYTGTKGIPELREAVSVDAKKYSGVDFDPAREIILTTGATESIYNVLMSLVDVGDEVVITDPTYLGYRETIELAQGQPKFLPVEVAEGYQPDGEKLKTLVTKKTKAVLILSPDNPTGRIVKDDFVKTLVDLAQDSDFWIISDEVYKHIVYEGRHVWISSFPEAKDHTITICSFSKEASIPGLRLGYTFAPKEVIDSIEKMQQYSTLAPDTLAQFALIKYLKEDMKSTYLKNFVLPQYRKRRDKMGRMLEIQLPLARTTRPAGAFYYFVDMREYLARQRLGEEAFCEKLLAETNVAVIPGGFFGDNGRGHVRMTFVTETEERIELGMKRIAEFLSSQ